MYVMYIYIYVYIYIYIYMYVCIYIYTYTYTHTHIHTYTYMHTYMHTYICINIHVCARAPMIQVCLEATGRGLAGSAWKVRLAINGPEAQGLRRLGFRMFIEFRG